MAIALALAHLGLAERRAVTRNLLTERPKHRATEAPWRRQTFLVKARVRNAGSIATKGAPAYRRRSRGDGAGTGRRWRDPRPDDPNPRFPNRATIAREPSVSGSEISDVLESTSPACLRPTRHIAQIQPDWRPGRAGTHRWRCLQVGPPCPCSLLKRPRARQRAHRSKHV